MSSNSTTPNNAKRLRLVWLSLLAVAVLVGFLPFARRHYTESDLYAVAGVRLRAGEEIYRLDERPFTYPPLLAVPCVPLSYMPKTAYRFVWYLSVCATLAAVVVLVLKRVSSAVGTISGRSAWVFGGAVFALAGRHLLAPVENQSHDLLIFLCSLLAIEAWSRRGRSSDPKAGAWAGVAAALKATPLLFLPLFLWQRRWWAVAAMGLAITTLTLAPDLFWPRRDGSLWVSTWFRTFLAKAAPGELATTPAWDPWCPLNQSVSGTLQRLLAPLPPGSDPAELRVDVCVLALGPTLLRATTLAALASVFAWMLWVARPGLTLGVTDGQHRFLRLGQGGVVLIAMVLLSPTSIKTHFGVLLLPIAVCVADYLHHGRDRLTGWILLAVFAVSSLTTKDLLGRATGNAFMSAGTVTMAALLLLAATGRIVLMRSAQWRLAARTRSDEPTPLPRAA